MCVLFTITLRQKPKGVEFSRRRTKTERKPVLRRLWVTPLGYCLRIIVKTKTQESIEKTKSSVVFFILTN